MVYLKCWKGKKYDPRILYSDGISCKNKGEIKTFSDKLKQRFLAGRHTLQEIINEVLQAKKKLYYITI